MKTIFLITLCMSLNCAVNAQGLLNKIVKKKQAEPQKTEKKVLGPNEKAAIDSASTFLDSQEIKKDSRGLSGIYYSNIPIRLSMPTRDEYSYAKKFLVNYIEDNKPLNTIEINTQYAYEATDAKKLVRRAVFAAGSGGDAVTTALKAGYVWLNATKIGAGDYEYMTHTSTSDLQDKEIFGEDKYTSWSSGYSDQILEVEPGILLIGNFWDGNTTIDYNKKFRVIVVFYKAEKADVAAKYTSEVCWDKVVEFQQKYDGTYKKASSDKFEMLAPVTDFKNAPKSADVTAAAQAFISKYQSSYKFEYAYTVSEWENVYKLLGDAKQNTLVARTLKAAIIATKNGECGITYVQLTQKNTFTTGSLTENFVTEQLEAGAASNVNTVDCTKANKYKK